MHHQDAERRDAPDSHEADEVVVLSVVGGTRPRGALPVIVPLGGRVQGRKVLGGVINEYHWAA
jgi:hypothetical protein